MSDVDEIRRRMALIRRDLHLDVSHVVGGVEEVMDWRSVVRSHPYVSICVGLAAGYFIVPRRRRVDPTSAMARTFTKAVPDRGPEETRGVKPRTSLGRKATGWALGMLWPFVSQSLQAYAAAWLESQLKQHLDSNSRPVDPDAPPSSARDDPYGGSAVYRMPNRS